MKERLLGILESSRSLLIVDSSYNDFEELQHK